MFILLLQLRDFGEVLEYTRRRSEGFPGIPVGSYNVIMHMHLKMLQDVKKNCAMVCFLFKEIGA